jgi:hypothetical protein
MASIRLVLHIREDHSGVAAIVSARASPRAEREKRLLPERLAERALDVLRKGEALLQAVDFYYAEKAGKAFALVVQEQLGDAGRGAYRLAGYDSRRFPNHARLADTLRQ